jgi:cellulose synthase/poly-beta-1,6-N-acetylglucosamine synthase-like glycosyltransferase
MDRPKLENKRFGRQMGLVLIALAGLGFWRDWPSFLSVSFLTLGAVHLILAVIAPGLLTGFNRFWMSLGYYFGKVFAPIEMAIIFFLMFTPIALVMRLFRRDALLIRKNKVNSYWKVRETPQISADSFRNQY